MYNISESCREALDSLRVTTKIKGKLILNDGSEIELESGDFAQGELSINSRCVSANDFEYGSVYCAEMIASIRTETDRYLFYDGIISVTLCILAENGSWEEIPLGVYNITEAERAGRKVELKAYDNMLLMGSEVDITDINGEPYDILEALAGMSDIRLAQTREQIEALPNGTEHVIASVTAAGTTPRDLLSELCVLLCAFAVFDRNGELEIRQYGIESVYTALGRKKTNTKISDYIVRYKGLKAQINGGYEYQTDEERDGLILDIGVNAFLQLVVDTVRERILQNMKAVLCTVEYVPCSTELITGQPALDLGDKIEVEDQYGTPIRTVVMSYDWKYRGRHTVKGVGSNPRTKVKSQTEKMISDAVGSVSTEDVIVKTATNLYKIAVKSENKNLVSINYATVADTTPIFIATIPLQMDADGNVVISYYLDSVLISDATVTKYLERGEHFVTVAYYLTAQENARYTLSLKAHTEYCESDIRKQRALIDSLVAYAQGAEYGETAIDSSVPNATVPKYGIKAVLFAQGLAGAGKWDGTITLSDPLDRAMPLKQVSFESLNGYICVEAMEPKQSGFAEAFGTLNINKISLS